MHKLFRGPVIVIDDEIGGDVEPGKADINVLVENIREKGYPCVTLKSVPENASEFISHLHSVSFLILDWRLLNLVAETGDVEAAGVVLPDGIGSQSIALLEQIKKQVFLPVFIFTNESVDEVKRKLVEKGLFNRDDNCGNFIFVREKNELQGDKLFTEIEDWLKLSTPIYVLKEWEQEYQKAKSSMFLNFYEKDHSWPKVLWQVYKTDDGLPANGLSDVLTRNLSTRMAPIDFKDEIVMAAPEVNDRNVLRRVLEGERFVPVQNLHIESIASGDFFYLEEADDEWKYLINIRASCDTVIQRKDNENPDLYLIKGREKTGIKKGELGTNHYKEKIFQVVVPCLLDGKIIEFDLKSFHIMPWNKLKDKRLGRLLDPHLNRLQEKYSIFVSFMRRQGVPGTPDAAYLDK